MGDITTIGWTDKTYNEWIGCQKVTEQECGGCYALRWANRNHMNVWESLSLCALHHYFVSSIEQEGRQCYQNKIHSAFVNY